MAAGKINRSSDGIGKCWFKTANGKSSAAKAWRVEELEETKEDGEEDRTVIGPW